MVVDLVPHPPKKVPRPLEYGVLSLGDDTFRHQVAERRDPEVRESEPQGGMEVPKTALTFLDVRLPQIDGSAVLPSRLAPFSDFLPDE